MRLSFAKLAFELGRRVTPERVYGDPNKLLTFPVVYEKGMSLRGGDVYLVRSVDLPYGPHIDFAGCFIVIGSLLTSIQEIGAECLIIVGEEHKPGNIYNHMLEIFREIWEWDEKLQNIMERGGSIQDLLDMSSPVFDNMLCVADENVNILAASYQGASLEIAGGSDMFKFKSETTYKQLSAMLLKVTPTVFTVDLGKFTDSDETCIVMFVNILYEREVIASLTLRPFNRPVGEHDRKMLERLAACIKRLLLYSAKIKESQAADIFRYLLKGEPTGAEKRDHLRAACGLESGNSLRCFIIAMPPQTRELDHGYLGWRFRGIFPYATAIIHNDCFVVLINESKSGWGKDQLRVWIASWLGDNSEAAGVSDRFENVNDLRAYYSQALAAFSFAAKSPDKIKEFADCRLEYAMSRCASGLPSRQLFPEGFRRLIEFNRSSFVDYIQTLRVWLDEGMNDNQAARRLFISRNSLLYRRDRLLDVLQMDIGDPETRFYLSFCLRLLEHETR
jgi:hypothetical protein